ncbi:MAG TPA: hypothetical protein VNC50_20975, partial [Planctomycetia bacterium]|nr:hypothetical protein [Planctomycetia bacterium]
RREFLIGVLVILLAAATWLGAKVFARKSSESLSRASIASMVTEVAAVDRLIAPARWIARGLLSASYGGREGFFDAAYNLSLLAANGAAAYLLAAWLYSRWYRQAFDRVRSAGTRTRKGRRTWLVALAAPALAPLARPVRALVAKDLRTFARDPLQWTQASIFIGLLILYLLSLGQVNYYARSPYWRTMLATFNLAVVGLMLSTFTSRFIFPLPSLEGRRFWLLGLAPVSRRAVLRGKLYFAATGGVLVVAPLVGLGALALKWSVGVALLQMGVAALLAIGLAAIAVGLGAYFVNPRESDPSRIASGFGGTVNLVTSLFFLATVIVALGIPAQAYALTLAETPTMGPTVATDEGETMNVPVAPKGAANGPTDLRWLGLGTLIAGAAAVAAVVAPMRMGLRAFERMEL